jgi:hypothetical protein
VKKILIFTFVFVLSLMSLAPAARAQENNNKFGIHIIDESDLEDAAALVNSNGGEWGYVTIVIREDERDASRWQKIFNEMRRLKLIPIIRIATKLDGPNWEAPKEEEAVNWAGFFNSLNWPVKNRYVVLFNEPNHAKEWGGIVDPAAYANTYRHYRDILKKFSLDFTVLPAALDLAAPTARATMSAEDYYSGMHDEDNFIFTIYDALNSHSYPNPGFSGDVKDTGKTSINGYKWETSFLRNFGLNTDLPVFITETGWIKSVKSLEENYKYAFENVWNDEHVVAVTPFLLNYLSTPFSDFSWKDPETKEFEPQYYSVQSITKEKGDPEQKDSYEFVSHNIADYLISDSEYSFTVSLKNTGQSIWNSSDSFELVSESTMKPSNIKLSDIKNVEPGQIGKFNVRLSTDEPRGVHSIKLSFFKNNKLIGKVLDTNFTLVSPPSLDIFARFWGAKDGNTASLSLYEGEVLVTKYDNVTFKNGKASIDAVKNVIPNKDYIFTLSKPFFSISRRSAHLLTGKSSIDFGILIPIDFNNDGNIDINDYITYISNPLSAKMRALPF